MPNEPVRAVGQEYFHDHGRPIAAQNGADSLVELLEAHVGVLLAGHQQQRAGVFLAVPFGAFDRVLRLKTKPLNCSLKPDMLLRTGLALASPVVIPITTQQEASATVIALDGQLTAADLGEVRRVRRSVKDQVILKLGGLNACVEEGISVLRDWLAAGARLSSVTPFLQIMLEKDQ